MQSSNSSSKDQLSVALGVSKIMDSFSEMDDTVAEVDKFRRDILSLVGKAYEARRRAKRLGANFNMKEYLMRESLMKESIVLEEPKRVDQEDSLMQTKSSKPSRAAAIKARLCISRVTGTDLPTSTEGQNATYTRTAKTRGRKQKEKSLASVINSTQPIENVTEEGTRHVNKNTTIPDKDTVGNNSVEETTRASRTRKGKSTKNEAENDAGLERESIVESQQENTEKGRKTSKRKKNIHDSPEESVTDVPVPPEDVRRQTRGGRTRSAKKQESLNKIEEEVLKKPSSIVSEQRQSEVEQVPKKKKLEKAQFQEPSEDRRLVETTNLNPFAPSKLLLRTPMPAENIKKVVVDKKFPECRKSPVRKLDGTFNWTMKEETIQLKTKEETTISKQKEDNAQKKKEERMKQITESVRLKREEKLQKAQAVREAADREKMEKLRLEKEKEAMEKLKLEELQKMKQEEINKKKALNKMKLKEAEERRLARLEEEKRKMKEAQAEQGKTHNLKKGDNNTMLEEKENIKEGKVLKHDVPDSYDLTPSRDERQPLPPKTETDYGIDDIDGDHSTDDETNPKKRVPQWAEKENLLRQAGVGMEIPSNVIGFFFAYSKQLPDVSIMFDRPLKITRTSSAVWNTPPKKLR